MGCFNINQVLLWEKDFDRNNLTRWCRKGLLLKLRNQYYAFPEFRQEPDSARFVANRIYMPSYISLHSALSFYGMIPEEVVQLTSVTTLKTARFENAFGTFHYQNVKTPLYFGFEARPMKNGRSLLLATPEKALADTILFTTKVPASLVGLMQFLEEDMRFDIDALRQMQIPLLKAIAEIAPKRTVIQNLITLCQR